MEIHQLRYFVAVAEEGSFSRAAAREHVAQPSLSQQIQKLEAEMDHRLFDRLSRSVVVTEAGKCLLDYARKILGDIAESRRCLDDLKQDVAGRLTIGAILTMAPYVLPKLVEKFQTRYPKVELEIQENTTENLAVRLEEGTLDVAIMSTCQKSPALDAHPLGSEPLFVLVASQHRLAKKKQISWSDLKSEKFLLLHEVHCLSAQICQLLAAHHLRPELALRGEQLTTIAQMVATRLGVSVVPRMMVEHDLPGGCVALPFTPPPPAREINLLRNPLRHQTKAATAFQQEAVAFFSR
jgi:LysR family transcriptional regulator, hydrogen peroxide-inducible genes activator